MHSFFYSLCVPLLLLGQSAQARVVERIVAVVNGDIILESTLQEQMKPFLAEVEKESDPGIREKRMTELRREVLERMIDEELIQQQATDLKAQVTPEDVDRAMETVKKQNKLDDAQLVEALKREGLSLAQYRQLLKRQVTAFKVKDIAIRSRVSISDEEIKAYYEQNVRGIVAEKKVHATHIFVGIPEGASTRVVEEKRAMAAELVSKARSGEDFAKLAREHSEDPATRKEGGDLGWFGKGALPASVEEIVFAMEPGEVRGPVRAERGFHIIKMLERKAEQARPLEEVKEQLRQQLFGQEMEKQTRIWLTELRKKSHVEVRQ